MRCHAEYEWGVHVSGLAAAAGLDGDHVYATRHAPVDAPIWTADETAIIRLCDTLHERARIDESCWSALRAHFDEAQCLELIYLCGLYTCVSFLVNGLQLPPEPFAARFDPGQR